MQARNAARVLPEPVGAEIRVGRPARICGQPSIWGSVGVPNLRTNHSATRGCAQASVSGIVTGGSSATIGTAVPRPAESPEAGSGNGNFSQEFPTKILYADVLLSP